MNHIPAQGAEAVSQVTAFFLMILAFSSSAVAQTTPSECTVPETFDPLFDLLDTIAQLAFVGGLAIGTIGLLIAAIYIMLPGPDNTRIGKTIAKHTIIGTILLLSANMIMTFLTSQLGTALCT